MKLFGMTEPPKVLAAQPPKVLALTEKDNGSSVIAVKDDRIVINLAWNPSSGFFWQEADTTAGVLEEVKHDPGDVKPGSIARVTFKFKIINEGTIQLHYARPWVETEPPAKWFMVNVKYLVQE